MAADCPSVEELSAYLIGDLPGRRADEVALHVDTCADCQTVAETLDQPHDKLVLSLRQSLALPAFVVEDACRRAVARIQEMIPAPWNVKADDLAVPAAPSTTLTRLGGYELVAKLGEGGMGAVYKARQPRLDRWVAVKVLPVYRLGDARAVARFQREIKSVGNLQHHNIVVAHDAGEENGMHYLVMEYVDGWNLSDLARRCGPLAIADACQIVRQAALALQHAHEHGLVHRDVKPSNLMLTTGGQVKLLDLGLALPGGPQTAPDELTGTNQMMGTADYMAPEQAGDSHAVDIRADVYSLGCTLYKLLTGEAPFVGPHYATSLQKMMAHVNEPLPPISKRRSDVPAALVAVLAGMLAKKPADRYATPAAAAAALAPFAANSHLPGLAARCASASSVGNAVPGVAGASPLSEAAAPAPSSNTGPELADSLTGTRSSASLVNAVPGVPSAVVSKQGQGSAISPRVEPLARRTISVVRRAYGALAPVVRALCKIAFSVCRATATGMVHALRTLASRDRTPRRRRLMFFTTVACAVLFAGVILFVATWHGTVRVEINDPAIEVVVDGTSATIKRANAKPIALRPGEHVLRVKYRDLDFETDKFKLNRGDTAVVTVELLPGRLQVAKGGTVLGEQPLPAIAPFDAEHAKALQEAWAHHLGTEVEVTNSLGMKLRLIPPGEFLMGTEQAEIRKLLRSWNRDFGNEGPQRVFAYEGPQHRVRLTRAFHMANHEVTRKQYHDMMGVNAPSSNAVTNVTWLDAVDFCNELSDHEALPLFYLRQGNTVSTQGGVGYRLPTEAEWEYGCRAGTTTFWSLGDNEQQFAEHVDVDGRLPANPFGLFDMHGSVVEWCWDWYGAYDAAEARDPTGPVTGKAHVIRGGTSTGPLVYRRSAIRLKNNPNEAAGPVGFRVVRTFAPTKEAGVNAPNADHAK